MNPEGIVEKYKKKRKEKEEILKKFYNVENVDDIALLNCLEKQDMHSVSAEERFKHFLRELRQLETQGHVRCILISQNKKTGSNLCLRIDNLTQESFELVKALEEKYQMKCTFYEVD